MNAEAEAKDAASIEALEPANRVTYVATARRDGDAEAGALMLDLRPIGRLSRRRRPGAMAHPAEGAVLAADSVWHAEAVGWLPHEGRPWDARVTTTAPTRRRAAEDLIRAYRNHR